jgi:hypothetical protein
VEAVAVPVRRETTCRDCSCAFAYGALRGRAPWYCDRCRATRIATNNRLAKVRVRQAARAGKKRQRQRGTTVAQRSATLATMIAAYDRDLDGARGSGPYAVVYAASGLGGRTPCMLMQCREAGEAAEAAQAAAKRFGSAWVEQWGEYREVGCVRRYVRWRESDSVVLARFESPVDPAMHDGS